MTGCYWSASVPEMIKLFCLFQNTCLHPNSVSLEGKEKQPHYLPPTQIHQPTNRNTNSICALHDMWLS